MSCENKNIDALKKHTNLDALLRYKKEFYNT